MAEPLLEEAKRNAECLLDPALTDARWEDLGARKLARAYLELVERVEQAEAELHHHRAHSQATVSFKRCRSRTCIKARERLAAQPDQGATS